MSDAERRLLARCREIMEANDPANARMLFGPPESELSVRIQTQMDEFKAVAALAKTFRELPPVVDDDYPEMRHRYESAMKELIRAMAANGRLEP